MQILAETWLALLHLLGNAWVFKKNITYVFQFADAESTYSLIHMIQPLWDSSGTFCDES